MIKILSGMLVAILFISCKQEAPPTFAPEYLHPEKDMQVITSLINNRDSTISIIYGNEQALQYARASEKVHHPAEKYVMVTAHLRPMPRWYGTNMNGGITRIEQVTATGNKTGDVHYTYSQQHNTGETAPAPVDQAARIRLITSQPAAVFP